MPEEIFHSTDWMQEILQSRDHIYSFWEEVDQCSQQFTSFFEMKAMEIVVMPNKYNYRDTETLLLQSQLNQYLKGFMLFSRTDHAMMSTSCLVQQNATLQESVVCLILHITNKQTC